MIALRGEVGLHGVDQGFVGELQGAIERVGEQLAGKVVEEFGLAMIVDEIAQAVKAYSVDASGIGDGGVDGAAGKVFGADVTDGSVAFIGESERIKALMAGGAHG